MPVILLLPCAGANSKGLYWLDSSGKPKTVQTPIEADTAGAALRARYASGSVAWLSRPKSFALDPPSCNAHNDVAVKAFTARYAYGWMKGQRAGAVEAVRHFDPSFYYTKVTDRESASGGGSDLGKVTTDDRAFIAMIIRQYNISTMIDVPAGDVNWQFGAWELDALTSYVGLDIVPHVVEFNSARYSHHSNKIFANWDMANCAFPRIRQLSTIRHDPDGSVAHARARDEGAPVPAELILSRHVLNHLPLERARRAAANLVSSGSRYQLISADYNTSKPSWACMGIACQEGGFMLPDMAALDFPRPHACSTYGICLYEFDDETRQRWLNTHQDWLNMSSRMEHINTRTHCAKWTCT